MPLILVGGLLGTGGVEGGISMADVFSLTAGAGELFVESLSSERNELAYVCSTTGLGVPSPGFGFSADYSLGRYPSGSLLGNLKPVEPNTDTITRADLTGHFTEVAVNGYCWLPGVRKESVRNSVKLSLIFLGCPSYNWLASSALSVGSTSRNVALRAANSKVFGLMYNTSDHLEGMGGLSFPVSYGYVTKFDV